MAIPRLSMKAGKPGMAGPHSAYIARQGEYAERLERGEKLELTEAGNLPAWAQHNPQEFWRASDQFERRNGSTYREMEIALPRELSPDQRAALVRDFVRQEIGERHAYQWAIHNTKAADEGEQPHLHLMFSERRRDGIERDPEQYFKRYNAKAPEKGGARKEYGNVDPALKGAERKAARAAELRDLRGRWESMANQHLERAGRPERIDMRSLKDQGIERQPERKLLPSEWRTQRAQVLAFRAARREQEAAQAELRRAVPNAGAMVIDLERAREARQQASAADGMAAFRARFQQHQDAQARIEAERQRMLAELQRQAQERAERERQAAQAKAEAEARAAQELERGNGHKPKGRSGPDFSM